MKVYIVSSRRDDCVIGVYSTLERAMAEGAEYTEGLQALKGIAPAWYLEDYEVWIEQWEVD